MVKFNTLILNNSEKIHTFVLNFIHFYLQNNLFSDLTIYETNNHLEHYNDIIMKIPYQIYTEDKKTFKQSSSMVYGYYFSPSNIFSTN